ncbi:MAG: hypothetical protein ACKVP5_08065 [Aestuariivirga sp.]
MMSIDILGYLAGACLLMMAAAKTQTHMRAFNIAGNVFFVAYGVLGNIMPVLVLNTIMIGLHAYRLSQLWRK